MKMKELIDGVSKIYREKRNEAYALQQELNSVRKKLLDAEKDEFEHITVAEHSKLKLREQHLRIEIRCINQYCEGISCAREYLMDLGFDTEVT